MFGINKKQPKHYSDGVDKGIIADALTPSSDGYTLKSWHIDDQLLAKGEKIYQALKQTSLEHSDNHKFVPQNLLCLLAAHAGYSCQANLRELFIEEQGLPERGVFVDVETKDGKRYFYRDNLNKPITDCIWPCTIKTGIELGAKRFNNLEEAFKYVTSTIGKQSFGVLRVPRECLPEVTPDRYVRVLWPTTLKVLKASTDDPRQWPLILTAAIEAAIKDSFGILDFYHVCVIVTESAIVGSKIDINQA